MDILQGSLNGIRDAVMTGLFNAIQFQVAICLLIATLAWWMAQDY